MVRFQDLTISPPKVGNLYIAAVKPYSYSQAGSQTGYDICSFRDKGIDRVIVPIGKAYDSHQVEHYDNYYGEDSAEDAYFLEADEIDDGQNHYDSDFDYSCGQRCQRYDLVRYSLRR